GTEHVATKKIEVTGTSFNYRKKFRVGENGTFSIKVPYAGNYETKKGTYSTSAPD
ncbi:MAG: hypothetical protein ABEK59_05810, partial [Halobacteria archaeon]